MDPDDLNLEQLKHLQKLCRPVASITNAEMLCGLALEFLKMLFEKKIKELEIKK